jgi:hypothetical protein
MSDEVKALVLDGNFAAVKKNKGELILVRATEW